MKTLYILTTGTVLRRVGRRLILEKGKQRMCELPLKDVGRILIYGHTEVTSQTMCALMEKNIPLFYLRRSGRLKGKIAPTVDGYVSLRQRQYSLFHDPSYCLALARSFVDTKLANMEVVIIHLMQKRKGTGEACFPIQQARKKLASCLNNDELMGVEGAAARHYFRIYGSELPKSFQFQGRSRRPAIDPANALLNLGYMTLLREIHTHVEAHHLDPYLGVLHANQDQRPSLALDLLEEFRQMIIDLFVFKLLTTGYLTTDHFKKTQAGGIEMAEDGFQKFFRLYEEHMGNRDGEHPGLRKLLDDQVASLKKHLMGDELYQHMRLELSSEETISV